MKFAIALALALGGFLALTPRAEACSIRGTFCNYPSWAANAFEGRFGFKGKQSNLTDYYVGMPPRKVRGPRDDRYDRYGRGRR